MNQSCLELVLGKQTVKTIAQANIFIVGVGGIGCQLLKGLSKSGFRKFTILDLDHIEQTNLNRQFYFRQSHIGQPKALIGRQSLLKIDKNLDITAYNGSIYDSQFDCKFFKKFDVLVSALDNRKAREYLSKVAIENDKPFVDAGTAGYNGQANSSIRFLTSCYNCSPSKVQQSFANCTIRSRPERPIHCITYAKSFYDSFFGGEDTHSLRQTMKYQSYITKDPLLYTDNQIKEIAIKLYQTMFDQGIKDIDDDGIPIPLVRKIPYLNALESTQPVQNPTISTYNEAQNKSQKKSVYEEQKLWSLKTYAEKLVQSLKNLIIKKGKGFAPQKFEKDDIDCATLICCITNLRTANFMNYVSESNKHKFLTLYQCKDIAGKIQPAIASTNSIAAALEIKDIILILQKKIDSLRFISINNYGQERIVPALMGGNNIDCTVCSDKCIYASVLCDFSSRTFGQFQIYAKDYLFLQGRPIRSGNLTILKPDQQSPNRNKKLNFNPNIISQNGVIQIQFIPIQHQTPLQVVVNLINQPNIEGFELVNTPSKQQLSDQIIRHYYSKHKQTRDSLRSDIESYGFI